MARTKTGHGKNECGKYKCKGGCGKADLPTEAFLKLRDKLQEQISDDSLYLSKGSKKEYIDWLAEDYNLTNSDAKNMFDNLLHVLEEKRVITTKNKEPNQIQITPKEDWGSDRDIHEFEVEEYTQELAEIMGSFSNEEDFKDAIDNDWSRVDQLRDLQHRMGLFFLEDKSGGEGIVDNYKRLRELTPSALSQSLISRVEDLVVAESEEWFEHYVEEFRKGNTDCMPEPEEVANDIFETVRDNIHQVHYSDILAPLEKSGKKELVGHYKYLEDSFKKARVLMDEKGLSAKEALSEATNHQF